MVSAASARPLTFTMRIVRDLVAGVGVAVVTAAGCSRGAPLQFNGSADLVIAATTDVHGRVRGWDYYANAPDSLRGLARVSTIVDSLRRSALLSPVVVDAGDIIQGNPLAFVA